MKKVNSFTLIKVGLSLSLVIPGFVLAEEYSTSQLQADTSRVESILKPSTRGSSADNGVDAVDAILQNVKKTAEQNKKESELRDKVRSWVKKNDGIDSTLTQVKGLEQKALKDRGVNLKQAEALAAQVSQTQSLANPSDFNTGNLPKACSKGVDLQQFKGLMDMMQSQAGQRLSSQASSMLSDKIKENKAAQQQKLLTLMAEFKELASRDGVDEEKLVADTIKGAKGTDARIKELETDKLPGLKNKNKEKKSELVDGLFKFITTMNTVGDNDKEVTKLGNEFANTIENSRQQALQLGLDSVDKLLSNCRSQVKSVYREIETTRRSLEPIVGVDAANLDAQAQIARANKLQCTDVADNVQAMLSGAGGTGGVDINSTLTQIRSEKNPTKLMVKAIEAMQGIAGIQAQVGQQIRPLMDDCSEAAKGLEGLKQRGQQASQQQRSSTGSVATRGSSTGNRSGSFWNNSSSGSNSSHSSSSRTR